MKHFKKEDETYISGRGRIITVKIANTQRLRKSDGLPEVGEIVLIDGEKLKVLGAETSLNLMSPPYMSEKVGLIVKSIQANL